MNGLLSPAVIVQYLLRAVVVLITIPFHVSAHALASHLLGDDTTRLTALADNMLRFVIAIYSDELNYLHEKKNNRRPF